jgi:aminoglycoside 9-adenylyltransferase
MDTVINPLLAHLDQVDPGGVVGVYLYGSATAGGLRPHSDLDLLLLTRRSLTRPERRGLVKLLLSLSGWPGHAARFPEAVDRRPVELTSLVLTNNRPWSPPAWRDLQYGEWLRIEFVGGVLPEPTEDLDVPILLATALGSHLTLRGPQLSDLIAPVPHEILRQAMFDLLPGILEGLSADEGEERHMLLTLARILVTLETGLIVPKDEAANHVAVDLPEPHAQMLERARASYLGEVPDDWSGLSDEVYAAAEYMVVLARRHCV